MFEALVAICIAFSFDSDKVNPCKLHREERPFRTHAACRSWGNSFELKLYAKGTEDRLAIVAHTACVKRDGS